MFQLQKKQGVLVGEVKRKAKREKMVNRQNQHICKYTFVVSCNFYGELTTCKRELGLHFLGTELRLLPK